MPFPEELLPVYVFIHASQDLKSFRETLCRADISVTANATSAAPPPRLQAAAGDAPSATPAKATIDSVTLHGDSAVQIVNDPHNPDSHYAIFETQLYLRYPATRLHRPAVHFTASAILKAIATTDVAINDDSDYLPSTLPEAENLLENLVSPLKSAYGVKDSPLNLPSSRVVKVAPRAAADVDEARPLRTASKLYPLLPILVMRVSTTALPHMHDMLATLNVELTRYVSCNLDIQDIAVKANNLRVEALTDFCVGTLHPGDRTSFMYKLLSDGERLSNPAAVLDVEIHSSAHVSSSCKPRIRVQWRGSVTPMPDVGMMSQAQRPSSRSSIPSQDLIHSRPVSKHLSMSGRPLSTIAHDLGVTLAFGSPSTVNHGDTFNLEIFIVNRTSRRKRLAVVAVPQSPKGLQASVHGVEASKACSGSIEAILDSRSLFGLQGNQHHRYGEVVCLNADVRVGPLPPGTCHNVGLEFLTLSKGVVGLAAIHVVDLDTKESIEVTDDLPAILCV